MTAPLDDFSVAVNKVRAYIPDVEYQVNPNRPGSPPELMFSQAHLQAFLDLNNGSVKLAAADACETLGRSEGMIAKVIKTEDLETDGAKLMAQFLQSGRLLREQARNDDVDDGDGLMIVEHYYNPPMFDYR